MATDAEANLAAFLRYRAEVPPACSSAVIRALSRVRGCDDPVVTFSGLPRACVPEFADGCQVDISDVSDASGSLIHVSYPPGSSSRPGEVLSTPFSVASVAGYPSCSGIVTHWWTGLTPTEGDAVIADLMVKHLIALVDHERLMAMVARAEDRAASVALEAISGRTISIAIGIVMRQNGMSPEDAEDLLRQCARTSGRDLHQVAAGVVRSGSLGQARAEVIPIRPA
jgi:hypothetical protein